MEKEEIREGFDLTTRGLSLRADTIDTKAKSVESVFSTEQPVTVYDYEEWRLIDEILISNGVQFSGDRIVMLDSHMRFGGIKTIVGSGREIKPADGKVIGRLFFAETERSDEAWKLVDGGHLTDVSVGYRADEFVDIPIGQKANINGVNYENTGQRVLRITSKWTLREISLVPIGADDQAKIREMMAVPISGTIEETQERTSGEVVEEKTEVNNTQRIEVNKVENITEEEVKKREKNTLDAEQKRVDAIIATGKQLGIMDEALKAVSERMSVDDFNQSIVNKKIDDNKTIDTRAADLGMEEKDVEDYSILRGIQALIMGNPEHASYEMSVSRELAERTGVSPNGFLVPSDVMMAKRAITVAGSGGNLVGTDHLASSFIDLLRNKTLMRDLGIRLLTGLKGDVSIPKQTGAATAYWVAEGGVQTLSDSTYGALALSPKTVAAGTSFTRKMLLQSDPSIQNLVMNDLIAVLGRAIDLAIIDGTGLSEQPTGILNTSGIGAVSGLSFSWADVLDFETDVATANADDGTMGFLTNPSVRGLMKQTLKGAGVPGYLWESDNTVNGYPGYVSNQVPAATAIQGVWSQFLLAMWGGLDISVDLATLVTSGGVVVRGFQSIDMGARQAGACSASEDIAA